MAVFSVGVLSELGFEPGIIGPGPIFASANINIHPIILPLIKSLLFFSSFHEITHKFMYGGFNRHILFLYISFYSIYLPFLSFYSIYLSFLSFYSIYLPFLFFLLYLPSLFSFYSINLPFLSFYSIYIPFLSF